jgi:hypothetical protein
MRTRNGPWWVVLLLVGVWGGGVKAAETPLWMQGTSLSKFIAENPQYRALALDWLYGVITGPNGVSERVDQTCAFVAGAGSKPRLDGGLGALQPYDLPRVVGGIQYDYVDRQLPGTDIVIIDEFVLQRLIDAMKTLVDRPFADRSEWRGAIGSATLEAFATWLPHPAGAPTYDVQHGHLVLHHVLALLGGQDIAVVSATHHAATHGGRARGTIALTVEGQPFSIHLEPIDFDDVTTIRSALEDAARVQNAVVVASWGLVDCELADRYEQATRADTSREWTIDRYLLDLFAGSPDAEMIAQELCTAFLDSPFAGPFLGCGERFLLAFSLHALAQKAAVDVGWSLWEDDGRYGRVFASAGNQRLPFPMPPAAWPGVFGVAACSDDGFRAWYSNVGDFVDAEHLVAPGAWFPVLIDGHDLGYWGTSFAAPHAALALGYEALNLPMGDELSRRNLDPCYEPPLYEKGP